MTADSDSPPRAAVWCIVHANRIGFQVIDGKVCLPSGALPIINEETLYYRRDISLTHDGSAVLLAVHDQAEAPDFLTFASLRQLVGRLDKPSWMLASRALQVLSWQKSNQFCGQCGVQMIENSTELQRKCPACGYFCYPQIAPAVIMAVHDTNRILLGRSAHFSPGIYSTLAGFVEAGETLEEAVQREVWEEVHVMVEDIRYIGSQPWPFPHSLMLGFTARYLRGELSLSGSELEDAKWFPLDALPPLPAPGTIARQLIDLIVRGK